MQQKILGNLTKKLKKLKRWIYKCYNIIKTRYRLIQLIKLIMKKWLNSFLKDHKSLKMVMNKKVNLLVKI